MVEIWRYYWTLTRAILNFRFIPKSEQEVPAWCLGNMIHLWHRKCHAENLTFAEYIQTSQGVSMPSFLIRYRIFAVLALYLWPIVALLVVWKHKGNRWVQWQYAIRRPDLYASYPKMAYSQQTVEERRSDVFLGIFNFWDYWKQPSSGYEINHKSIFEQRAKAAGLPVARNLSLNEAKQFGDGPFIVKDPSADMGLGVKRVSSYKELTESVLPDSIIQLALENHPELLKILPPRPPLCTLRLTTILAPEGPRCTNAFFRIGASDSEVDNLFCGGTMVEVEIATGKLLPGVPYSVVKGKEYANDHLRKSPGAQEAYYGLKLLQFEEAVSLVYSAHRVLAPRVISLGWDVALTTNGPVLIEANTFPGTYETFHFCDSYGLSIRAVLQRIREYCAS